MTSSQTIGRLYHAPSSYYSSIARLALAEAGIEVERVRVDFHRRLQNFAPSYARLNPNLTVPTLELPDRVVADSRDIVLFAFGGEADAETTRWLDRHYAYSIEELTFAWLLAGNPIARWLVPRRTATLEARLRRMAVEHPDLAEVYLRRAEALALRRDKLAPAGVAALRAQRLAEAGACMDALDAALADGREHLVGAAVGPADVVWTAFLARVHFIGQGHEIERRPGLARWWSSMSSRPSFRAADVWTRLKPIGMLRQVL